MITLHDASIVVIRLARAVADDAPVRYWNRLFEHEVQRQGFMIVPVPDTYIPDPGPARAPDPHEIGYRYPYPSVIAPKDWKLITLTPKKAPSK